MRNLECSLGHLAKVRTPYVRANVLSMTRIRGRLLPNVPSLAEALDERAETPDGIERFLSHVVSTGRTCREVGKSGVD